MDSFKDQYPDYKIIPEPKSKWKWPLIWALTLGGMVGLPAYMMYVFSSSPIPISNMAGFNPMSLPTMAQRGILQSEAGQHQEAIKTFRGYFTLGGNEPEAMKAFATSLNAVGENDEAKQWESKAARFMREIEQ